MKCRKCHRMGHVEIICKEKGADQQGQAQTATHEVEQLFAASCLSSKFENDDWLVNSGYTNYKTNNVNLFKELDRSISSRVKIGNGDFIAVKGKGIVIESRTSAKFITDVLYMPEIDQNLLGIGKLFEKGYKKNEMVEGLSSWRSRIQPTELVYWASKQDFLTKDQAGELLRSFNWCTLMCVVLCQYFP
ncbi:hypothetical protein CRG98_005891 [Punica granatum]|uniref:Retrovirus-related Pol polyprotein from transposon TNT 1-94-like beta-barrel domain-containing protein n=1 Tax=Punica granatum TaxID=22663 RepID=A0A2I0KZ85_PUNGR|nr:hypothetical protein CRG98_005891 [Punica granatum]